MVTDRIMDSTRRTLISARVLALGAMLALVLGQTACIGAADQPGEGESSPAAERTAAVEYTLTADQTHSRFSSTIPPVLRVASGAVIEAELQEASAGQLTASSSTEDLSTLSFDPIHPLTGPVYVEGAEPGDVLAVTLHEIEVQDWGWIASIPGFGLLADDFPEPILRTLSFEKGATAARFSERIRIPLRPFPGVMAVSPPTDSLLSTIPPRANGGNMDNPFLTEGTTVYFPVFVEGALFSLGDPHIAQGKGEVSGTGIEGPLRVVYQLELLKGVRSIPEPQYETDEYYAVTAHATTLDEAVQKATRYMIDYLVAEHGLERGDAYLLASIAADLEIAEVVDMPHVLVAMHISKEVLGVR
jgi:acetamidase/formamidase